MEVKLIKTDCPMYRKQNAMFIKKKNKRHFKGHRWKIRGWKNVHLSDTDKKKKEQQMKGIN